MQMAEQYKKKYDDIENKIKQKIASLQKQLKFIESHKDKFNDVFPNEINQVIQELKSLLEPEK